MKRLMPPSVIHVRDMAEGDVYIGRRHNRLGLPASKWANPHHVDAALGGREQAVEAYRRHLLASKALLAALPELRGKRLACWCAPQACHGDVLLELANGGEAV